jgi:hypothetical protein
MKEPLQQLREVHAIQGKKGCYDIDDYMLGMFNGLELALCIMENRAPQYKERQAIAEAEKQPKREWVGPTDEELRMVVEVTLGLPEGYMPLDNALNICRAVATKLKEKNT